MNFRVEHSELYQLEPIGIKGPFRESLTSYITRLSTAHCLPNKDFILFLTSRSKKLGNLKVAQIFFTNDSKTINGYTHYAREFFEIISELTLVKNIAFTTILHFKEVFDPAGKGLLKAEKEWCSSCYREQKENNIDIHDHLIWFIKNIKFCPIHMARLSFLCPHCKAKQPFLSTFTPIGQCANCGRSLASQSDNTECHQLSNQQRGYIDNMLQLLSISEEEVKNVSHTRMLRNIKNIINETTGGNAKKLNNSLGFGDTTIAQWRRGRGLPKFDQIMSFLLKTGVDVNDFFIGEVSNVKLNIDLLDSIDPKPKKTKHNHESIKKQLLKTLDSSGQPLSLKAVTKKLGVSEGYLRHRFTKETKLIVSRYKKHRENLHLSYEAKKQQKVISTVKKLHKQGRYPSQNRVFSSEFGFRRSELMKPSIHKVWKDTLVELGYQL